MHIVDEVDTARTVLEAFDNTVRIVTDAMAVLA